MPPKITIVWTGYLDELETLIEQAIGEGDSHEYGQDGAREYFDKQDAQVAVMKIFGLTPSWETP